MQKYWDVVAVGIITLVVVSVILMIKPGYTPLEISDEAMITPAEVMEESATEEAAAEVEVTEEVSVEAATEEATAEETEATEDTDATEEPADE